MGEEAGVEEGVVKRKSSGERRGERRRGEKRMGGEGRESHG